jgi:hypothetical protein
MYPSVAGNNAWPFLADFQLSVTRDIADRVLRKYKVTGTNQCGRGMAGYLSYQQKRIGYYWRENGTKRRLRAGC